MPQKQKRKNNSDEQNKKNRKNIGQRFRLFRKARNLTQHQMAIHLSVNDAAISNIETGKFDLRIDHLLLMQTKFKLNPNWILSGNHGMTRPPPETPENCRELFHLMEVPGVELAISSELTEIKKIFH